MGDESDAARLPPSHVAPREMREAPPAVGDIPPIEASGELRDHRAHGVKTVCLEHRKRVIAEAAVSVVERDDDLTLGDGAPALHDLFELLERQGAIPRPREPLDLARKAPRRDAGYPELVAALHLVVAENERE